MSQATTTTRKSAADLPAEAVAWRRVRYELGGVVVVDGLCQYVGGGWVGIKSGPVGRSRLDECPADKVYLA